MITDITDQLSLPELTETPTPLEMAKIVLDWAEKHPDNHDQDTWGYRGDTECGTTMCIAGTACVVDPNTEVRWLGLSMHNTVRVRGKRTATTAIEIRAADLLGLDEEQAAHLFFDTNNEEALDFLRWHIAALESRADSRVAPDVSYPLT
ncbi:hypothetical protein PBI_DYLAN_96 [Mycobacterium phage Dylan]|uniref:Uncharacterized protein n=1 Tax=Mycobacterium phage Dylan TaxID=1340831 RepID=S5YLS4_9CAUD|nr:hypothetical protein PBI_DYLAN_96 [Mycobacterium phage Dylan]AGT20726.1 hypothetical protein PBI_DYLAN_96 [Mycobacterium phage Dylan]ALA48938.1 hypothetical protein ZAKHE101_96 [Mycobacterium phage Zakhe101]